MNHALLIPRRRAGSDPIAQFVTLYSPAAFWSADRGTYTDAGTTPGTTNGAVIYRCDDQSGNDRHLNQATEASRPTLVTGELNGLPILRCDGTDDSMATGAFTLNQAWQLMIVCKLRQTTAGGSATWWDGGGGNAGRGYQSSPGYLGLYAGAGGPGISSDLSGSWNIFTATYAGTSTTLRQNAGAEIGPADAGAANPGGFTLAAFAGGSNVSYIDFAAAAIFSTPLTGATETAARNLLNTAFAVY